MLRWKISDADAKISDADAENMRNLVVVTYLLTILNFAFLWKTSWRRIHWAITFFVGSVSEF